MVELIKAGHHPIIVDDLSNARADVRYRIGQITNWLPALYEIDCADKQELQQTFTDRMANAVRMPVKREMPDSMKERLDEYLDRKRPKEV